MLNAPSTAASTFAFPGPQTYTFETLLALVEALTLKKLQGPNFPKPVLALAARLWDLVWWPTVSPDEVKRRYISDAAVSAGIKGFKELGIEPDVLEDVAIVYLRRYRSRYVGVFFLVSALGGRVGLWLTLCLSLQCLLRLADSQWRYQTSSTILPCRRLITSYLELEICTVNYWHLQRTDCPAVTNRLTSILVFTIIGIDNNARPSR